jgi:hypothetical protein
MLNQHLNRARTALLALMLVLFAACAAIDTGPSKQELIQGAWRADFQGQSMTLIYAEDNITVREFGISFAYEWVDEDHIRLDALGQEVVSLVEFETPDRMVQTSAQGIQVMTRVP